MTHSRKSNKIHVPKGYYQVWGIALRGGNQSHVRGSFKGTLREAAHSFSNRYLSFNYDSLREVSLVQKVGYTLGADRCGNTTITSTEQLEELKKTLTEVGVHIGTR